MPARAKKCISTLTKLIQCQTDKHVSQLVFTKPIPCRLAQNMYHNLCWPNPYLRHKIYLNIWFHASEDKNCTSTCVYQTHSKPARIKQYLNLCCSNLSGPANTQNVSHLVLIEPLTCQRRHKMHLNMCWPNPSHGSEEKEYISTCDYQTVPMTASTQNECEHTNWIYT